MNEQKSNPRPNKFIDDEDHHTGTRRRGELLEDAILQAAWDELSEVGYVRLTMEGVAARARTNKSVVYRRWENKATLIMAALHNHVFSSTKVVPNTGNLSNDVLILLRGVAQPLQLIGVETIHGLMLEHLGKNLISSIPQIMHQGTEGKLTTDMMTILKNAELRGEINLEKISSRIISLPLDLLRYEILTTHEPITDKTINEIIEDIFIPLVQA